MNIYFSGIGGSGIGPLAEIALDAGHTVAGSDPVETLMTRQLVGRGVVIGTDATDEFLRATHEKSPIDWFVHTAAWPNDHPEITAAKDLGIKVTKLNELLREIIREKNLKLVAVAGTHGKTTTTAMTVWAMKQLGVPVSYLVGSTLQFGPSGRYEPDSEYFVYECDEFDRNFLHFHPYLSLVTSIDYDHPDIYRTKEEYYAAFQQFIGQSGFCILWQKDAGNIQVPATAWLLGDHDVSPELKLAGHHNRQNASQVAKALEKLGVNGDVIGALNRYPGADRRFEKLAENLYSDYGHHPAEIAATLQLASELNDDVVLVYQPHQNVRQHEVADQYTDCFEKASQVYWLPTHLTREDPDLAVITPEELTKNVTNKQSIHFAELNGQLWQDILAARARGALVLCMGAGTIDGWVRGQLDGYGSSSY